MGDPETHYSSYFQFWLSQTSGQENSWRIIQNFSLNSTCQWTPEEPGRYTVVAFVSRTPTMDVHSPELVALSFMVE